MVLKNINFNLGSFSSVVTKFFIFEDQLVPKFKCTLRPHRTSKGAMGMEEYTIDEVTFIEIISSHSSKLCVADNNGLEQNNSI